MAGVSESIVREYFELHDFLVRQYRKHVAPAGHDDIDFLVLNPKPQPVAGKLPFVLGSPDLVSIERAIVVIKPWHTEVFSPALLNSTPDLFRFLEKRAFQDAVKSFGTEHPLLKIVIVPALPQDRAARDESIAIFRSKNIDGVIPFRTMLSDLVNRTEANRNYQKSDLLQTIRILKNYDLFKEFQLELFKPGKKRAAAKPRKAG